MREFWNVDAVREAARGRWQQVVAELGRNAMLLTPRHGPCPACGGRDRFRFDDKDGNGSFICSQGGGDVLAGDGIALVQHLFDCDWKEATNMVGRILGVPPVQAGDGPRHNNGRNVAPPPTAEKKGRPELDQYEIWEMTRGVPEIDAAFLARRSPVDVAGVTPAAFLAHLFLPAERVLIFQSLFSPGDFIWDGRLGTFRLSQTRGVKAVRSDLPRGGKDGIWYLVQPVSGSWVINGKGVNAGGQAKWTRRSEGNVTAWRHFVLESDGLAPDEWLKVVCNLRLPVCAIYTSGGRSIHALLRQEVPSKAAWDHVRNAMKPLLCPLGADPGAMSAVRLSRLPGCFRGERKQELLYLNPNPEFRPIWQMPEARN